MNVLEIASPRRRSVTRAIAKRALVHDLYKNAVLSLAAKFPDATIATYAYGNSCVALSLRACEGGSSKPHFPAQGDAQIVESAHGASLAREYAAETAESLLGKKRMTAPICFGAQVWGVVSVGWNDTHDFAVNDGIAIDAIARFLARALRREGQAGLNTAMMRKPDKGYRLVSSTADALGQSELRDRKVFEDNRVPMLVLNKASNRFVDVNDAACTQYGYSREEFLRIGPEAFYPSETALRPNVMSGETTEDFDVVHLKADGTTFDAHITLMSIPWDNEPSVLGVVQDISEHKALLATEKANNAAFTRAQQIAKVGNAAHDLISGKRIWSDEFFRILGLDKSAGVPATCHPYVNFFGAEDYELLQAAKRAALQDRKEHGVDLRLFSPNAETKWVRILVAAEYDSSGNATHMYTTMHDISDRKGIEERLEQQARIDALTGLPNRRAAAEHLKAVVAAAGRSGRPAAVLFLDIDEFKHVNDSLGHTAGDALLIEIAQRFRATLRASDYVCRMGGDEFVVILSDVVDPARVLTVAENIGAIIAKPIHLQKEEVVITVSIGIAMYPEDGSDAETLIMNADTAMFQGKRDGRARHCFFSPEMHAMARERLRLDGALRKAIEEDAFTVCYQPILSSLGDTIVASEALVRWPQLDGSILPPAAFIPQAEESGLIVPLGNWVLRTACARNARWNAATGAALRINVNVSAKQLADPQFTQVVVDALTESGLRADLLELELTETAIASSPEKTSQVVKDLRDAGVRVALDDFGTGYNSLVNLRFMRVDTIKLEKCFVDDIVENAIDQAIARGVLAAGRALGASVVAEGIENMAQRAVLRGIGFDEMQGYLFAQPMSGDALESLLALFHGGSDHSLLRAAMAA